MAELPHDRDAQGPGARVMIVDDDADLRAALEDMLDAEAGCRVTTHGSADEALAALEGGAAVPALVFLDYAIPGMTAQRFSAELKRRYGPGTRIVLITGYTAEHVPPDGAWDAVLSKPFGVPEVLDAVRRHAGRAVERAAGP